MNEGEKRLNRCILMAKIYEALSEGKVVEFRRAGIHVHDTWSALSTIASQMPHSADEYEYRVKREPVVKYMIEGTNLVYPEEHLAKTARRVFLLGNKKIIKLVEEIE